MASKYQEIEQQYGKPMAEILVDLYRRFDDKPNRQELVAQELGVTQSTVSLWIKVAGLRLTLVAPEPPPCSEAQPS